MNAAILLQGAKTQFGLDTYFRVRPVGLCYMINMNKDDLNYERLLQRAIDVFGDEEKAKQWFSSPQKALGGKTPLEYSESDVGAQEVEDLLGRIEWGVYS
ncbi:MAG: hypothetical protein CVU71_10330 [Deltaproteobacteria bacterium HGW-Deltaproteobacteria-6]|nr:MAG: hypothetical protein CVU71_10330 [Deltaproteobacteria bacterium HGW-Deltaproteobacteria-6]